MENSSTTAASGLSFKKEAWATLLLSLPLMAGQVGQMLMSLADTVMVGKVGVVPLAAATFANTLLIIPFLFGVGLLVAIPVRVSQSRSAQRDDEVRGVLKHGTWVSVMLGVSIFIITLLLLPFLGSFGQPVEVVKAMPVYFVLSSFSMTAMYISMTWKNFGDALNKPWVPFWILMAGVGFNVFLNWIFIHGNMGSPALGLNGAGLATLIARCATMVGLYFWLKKAKSVKAWAPEKLRDWWGSWDFAEFKQLFALGVPIGLQLVSVISAFSIGALMIGSFGVVPLAAHQVAIICTYTAAMIPVGIAMALVVRMGETTGVVIVGQRRFILLGGWLFSILFTAMMMVAFILYGYPIASWIVQDAEVVELAVKLLFIVGAFQIVDGFQTVSFSALRGMGDVSVPAWLSAFCYLGVAVSTSYILAFTFDMKAEGVWWGLATGFTLAAILLGIRSWIIAGRDR